MWNVHVFILLCSYLTSLLSTEQLFTGRNQLAAVSTVRGEGRRKSVWKKMFSHYLSTYVL